MNKIGTMGKVSKVLLVVLAVFAIGLIAYAYVPGLKDANFLAVAPTGVAPSAGNQNTNTPGPTVPTTYQPTATYSAIDSFSTATITGTAYYKADGQKASTTALTNVNKGQTYTYWVDNGTGGNYVRPVVFIAHSGVNSVQAKAWQNASLTITAYDTNAGVAIADASHNVSLAANGQANVDFKLQGTAKKSSGPFGGVMVLEYNSSIASVTCTGKDLQASNPFHVTYTLSSTGNIYKELAYAPSLDDGSGNLRHISCQFTNGATAMPVNGSAFTISMIPANNYVTNDGNIVLDTEQYLNGVNTRTGSGTQSASFYFVN